MSDDTALFPPTVAERLIRLVGFVHEERFQRLRMRELHSAKRDYWEKRIAQADAALVDLEALEKELT